jgi:hypothetical protein
MVNNHTNIVNNHLLDMYICLVSHNQLYVAGVRYYYHRYWHNFHSSSNHPSKFAMPVGPSISLSSAVCKQP